MCATLRYAPGMACLEPSCRSVRKCHFPACRVPSRFPITPDRLECARYPLFPFSTGTRSAECSSSIGSRIESRLPHEEEIVAQAARFCLRAIQNERVFLQLERAKVEQGKSYRAAQAFGAAWSEKDVVDAGVNAAREVASFDVAAVTVFDEAARTHEVVAAKSTGRSIEDLVGFRFTHNTGLASMVVQNRCPLPYRGEFESKRQVVLSRRLPWPDLPSLLVLPLLVHDRPLGALHSGRCAPRAFGEAVRRNPRSARQPSRRESLERPHVHKPTTELSRFIAPPPAGAK